VGQLVPWRQQGIGKGSREGWKACGNRKRLAAGAGSGARVCYLLRYAEIQHVYPVCLELVRLLYLTRFHSSNSCAHKISASSWCHCDAKFAAGRVFHFKSEGWQQLRSGEMLQICFRRAKISQHTEKGTVRRGLSHRLWVIYDRMVHSGTFILLLDRLLSPILHFRLLDAASFFPLGILIMRLFSAQTFSLIENSYYMICFEKYFISVIWSFINDLLL